MSAGAAPKTSREDSPDAGATDLSSCIQDQHGALTLNQFEALLQSLDINREAAADKYEQIRFKLIKFFEWSCCIPAEELADETLDRVARKIAANRAIEDLIGFVWGVAKKIRQEDFKRQGRTLHFADLRGASEHIGDHGKFMNTFHEQIDKQRQVSRLRRCLRCLSQTDRTVFLEYHRSSGHDLENRLRLARNLGISYGALRVRMNRLRERLEKCARSVRPVGRT